MDVVFWVILIVVVLGAVWWFRAPRAGDPDQTPDRSPDTAPGYGRPSDRVEPPTRQSKD